MKDYNVYSSWAMKAEDQVQHWLRGEELKILLSLLGQDQAFCDKEWDADIWVRSSEILESLDSPACEPRMAYSFPLRDWTSPLTSADVLLWNSLKHSQDPPPLPPLSTKTTITQLECVGPDKEEKRLHSDRAVASKQHVLAEVGRIPRELDSLTFCFVLG